MIKLMIVDDQRLVRDGIALLLNNLPNMQVIAKASNGEEAIKLAKEKIPDVILMDINMPGIGGIYATHKILASNPNIKIIALTIYVNEPFPASILKAGAKGYLTKGTSLEKMIEAIHAVVAGETYLDPEVAQQLALKSMSRSSSPFDSLSIREFTIMMMVAKGEKIKAISKKLCISPKTVNTYRYRLYKKLNVKNNVELTIFAIEQGLVDNEIL